MLNFGLRLQRERNVSVKQVIRRQVSRISSNVFVLLLNPKENNQWSETKKVLFLTSSSRLKYHRVKKSFVGKEWEWDLEGRRP